jgi:hypothetical protein
MDWATSSNIYNSQIVEEAVLTPHPTSWNAVNNSVEEREQTIRLEVASGK